MTISGLGVTVMIVSASVVAFICYIDFVQIPDFEAEENKIDNANCITLKKLIILDNFSYSDVEKQAEHKYIWSCEK